MIYPNFSPSDFSIKIDIHKKNGHRVYQENNFLQIKHENAKLLKINFNKILNENNLNENNYSALLLQILKKNKIPTRIKFGLDVGIKGLESKLHVTFVLIQKWVIH